jgi:hypothetical protein
VKKTPWPQSTSELYRPSDRRLSAKLVPTSVDRGCHVVSVTDPNGRNLGFLDRSHYYFFQVAPQLHSRGWKDPVPGPLLRKSGSTGNRTGTSWSVANDLFAIFMSRIWPTFWWLDSNMYLVFSTFIYRPTYLLASINISVFFFIVSMLSLRDSHHQRKAEADVSHQISVSPGFPAPTFSGIF